MTTISNIEKWGDAHYRAWMAPLRMFFGAFLAIKGLYYIENSDYIIKWFQGGFHIIDLLGILSIFFAFLHVFLGCFVIIGLATRFSCMVLIPVLLASVFFSSPAFNNPATFILTLISIIFCAFFIVEGSGKFSVYYFFSRHEPGRP